MTRSQAKDPVWKSLLMPLRRPIRLTQLRIARARHRFLPRLWRNPLLDAQWYRRTYRVKNAARDYRDRGASEGRKPNAMFDTRWYLERYRDIARSGMDPLDHYYLFGAWEGRNPGPDFDTSWYLERYPDVRASGQNPLQHYPRHGIPEKRRPLPKDADRAQNR
jgi:hypothetical protein